MTNQTQTEAYKGSIDRKKNLFACHIQFSAQYKIHMQLYQMIINQLTVVQKCFSTSILVQGLLAARVCTKLRSRSTFVQASLFFDHFVQLHMIFVLSGKLHVTSQQIFFLSMQWTLCMLMFGSNLSEFNVFYLFLDV